MNKALAFLRRDLLIATSYRTAFLIQLVSMTLWVPICYFFGEGLPRGASADAADGGAGDYFAFLLIGMGLLGYLTISLRTFNQSIRESQMMGTLEVVLLSPTSVAELLFFSSAWVYLFATLRFLIFLGVGALFGLELGGANALTALVVLALAVPAFAAFGIASAAVVLVIKRGESINLILTTASLLFGGVMYPIDVLPGWLRPASQALPITHALSAMRAALFEGASLGDVAPALGALGLFALVALPAALLLFGAAVRWTKATGTLAHY